MLILAIAGASLLVIFVDPFQVYRLATLYMPPIDNTTQVYANAGIARNYDYDSAIVGTSVTENFRPSQMDELLAAAAGPAMNLALLLAFSRTLPRFALVNFCLLAYNLLPFYPLDGGRLLRAVLRTLLPLRAAVWAERGVCLLCGALLLACAGYLTLCWHAGPWPLLVCLLLGLRCCRNEEI